MFVLNRLIAAATAMLAVPLLGGTAWAQATAPVSPMDVERMTATAQVVAVDPATRTVTIKAENGEMIDVIAGEDVRNFAQIKVGDVVVATVQRSLTFTVSPKGTDLPATMVVDEAARAKPGERPAGVIARSTSLSATIVAVDAAAHTVSIVEKSGGPVRVLEVRNPERQAYLPNITPGSLLTVTYTSALAVDVQSAAK
jgi:hypothetical protein